MTNSLSILEHRPVPCLVNNAAFTTEETFIVSRHDQSGETSSSEELYKVYSLGVKDVDPMVRSAHLAFQSWKRTTVDQRRAILTKAIVLLRERTEDIVQTIVEETVVGRGFARYQVERGAMSHLEECLQSLGAALTAQVLPEQQKGVQKYVFRQPYGVVLGIAPWNAPFVLALRAVLWAIAAGNTAILKTSEHACLTHLTVAKLFIDAGLPDGVLSVAHVAPHKAAEVTEALIAHPAVRKINFTGSTRVGRMLATVAASHLKPIVLELGGKAPILVLEDADVCLAANQIVFGGFLNANQICMAVNTIFVHERIKDALVNELRQVFAKEQKCLEAGFDASFSIRALFTEPSAARLKALYDDAIEKGATIAAGRASFNRALVQPVILDNVTPSMNIFSEETFGPVLSIVSFTCEEEAVRLANVNENAGLAAAVFGKDVEHAFTVGRQIEAGQVHINAHSVHDHGLMPHGGWKASGIGRLGGGLDGIREFTQTQGFTVQTGAQTPLKFL